jgi:choline dehydrogenase-like flavoprotein
VSAPDVVIVGAGPCGAVAALRFAQAGLSVVCLEQGDWPDAGVRPTWGDAEVAARGSASWSPEVRRARGDFPIAQEGSDVGVLAWNGVGGGTVQWGAQWERFVPSDFRVRTLDGVADDWPLTYAELEPYYDRLDRAFGLAAQPGDPAFPAPGGDPAYPPLPLMGAGERIARAHNALGWHWWPGPNVLGPDALPYRRGTRASADRTHWPAALAAGVELITGARVARVLADGRGGARATGVAWIDREGREHETRAPLVVLAAGAIGTARLLLLSDGPGHPDGLGNGSGLVGRRLMLHPFTRVAGLFDEDLGDPMPGWGQLVHCLEFTETDATRGFVRGAKWNLTGGFGPAIAATFPWPGEPRWGAAIAEHTRAWYRRSAVWGITADDLPDPANRVVLDAAAPDADGVPGVRVTYRTPPDAQRILAHSVERATESLEAAGATRVLAHPQLRDFGWHQLGTARMGDDGATSVVDRDSRLHEVPNVLVADASVFVTGSSLNPTATACALALRAVERVLETRGA